jgi:hypothetical protein
MQRRGTEWYLAILVAILLLCGAGSASGQAPSPIAVGRLASGGTVQAVRSTGARWELKIEGDVLASSSYSRPVQLEFYDPIRGLEAEAHGYDTVTPSGNGITGRATVRHGGNATFTFEDHWSVSGNVLSLERQVLVAASGPPPRHGFMSAITFFPEKPWSRPQVDILAPGMIYGGLNSIPPGSTGSAAVYQEGRGIVRIREDRFPSPLFGVRFSDGSSLALLDPTPRGGSTQADSFDAGEMDDVQPLTDSRFEFGALGEDECGSWKCNPWEPTGLSLSGKPRYPAVGFWYPGTEGERTPARGGAWVWRRRFHPVRDGFRQNYRVMFRIGANESFPEFLEKSSRWAWETLRPPVIPLDIEVVRQSILDMLVANMIETPERAGLPFFIDAARGETMPDARFTKLGFLGRNVQAADQFLQESARSSGDRAERFHRLAVKILDSFARLKYAPPEADGFWIDSGKPVEGPVFLRSVSEDLYYMLSAYRREKANGRDHPLWIQRCREFADWLLAQRGADGGFPRAWKQGTSDVVNASTLGSYFPIPLLAKLTEATGDQRFLAAAIQAGHLSWEQGQKRGQFFGGTIDNPNIPDKEAGVLSLNAYLHLYEATHDKTWLDCARFAAAYAETWVYLWNVAMPEDIADNALPYKRGVPTAGVQLISVGGSGADEYMSEDVALYAKLYRYTGDSHYLDVARVLLHDTKSMLAIPGRTYDLAGPGFQEESWTFVIPRNNMAHRVWLPWISVVHLNGIMALEEFDASLFRQVVSNDCTAVPCGKP